MKPHCKVSQVLFYFYLWSNFKETFFFCPRKMYPILSMTPKLVLLTLYFSCSHRSLGSFSTVRSIRTDGADELRCCTINPLSLFFLKILGWWEISLATSLLLFTLALLSLYTKRPVSNYCFCQGNFDADDQNWLFHKFLHYFQITPNLN